MNAEKRYHLTLRLGAQAVAIKLTQFKNRRSKMKTITCNQLGGACDKEFQANTFEEVAEISKQHGMEMFQKQDEAHLKAMNEMRELMQKPEAMKDWFEDKKKEFDSLPED